MYFSNAGIKYILRQEEFHGQMTNESKSEIIQPNIVNSQETTAAMAGSLLAFILFWGSFLFILSKKNTWTANNTIISLKNIKQKLPCSQCRFAANNHYLKCAVQPTVAFTQEATNCSDFCPLDN